jgi:NADPH:quinone reductase
VGADRLTVRALELQSATGPDGLRLAERGAPAPDGHVLIEVRAAGVSFPDLLMSQGRYQVQPPLPAVLGLEAAGVVRAAPAGCGVSAGDRVWAALEDGGHAELVAAPCDRVFPLPDALGYEEGAALPANFLTAIFALCRRGVVRAGETVVVLGAAGGLGSALVGVAAALGARAVAVVSTSGKGATARSAGAHEVVVGTDWRDAVLELTGGRGADVVADVVGGDQTLQAIRSTAPEGRVLLLGFASGEIPSVAGNRLLLRNVSVVGVGLGALVPHAPEVLPDAARRLAELVDAGLRPVIGATFPLADGARAFRLMEARGAEGKLVLTL